MQKFCTKCGKELFSSNSFCVNCGNRNDIVPEPGATPRGPEEKHNASNTLYNFLSFITVMFVAIMCLLAIASIKGNFMNNTPSQNPPDVATNKEDFTNLTNPDYLASPGEFIIDKNNDISSTPPQFRTKSDSLETNRMKRPVWVEDILDENTLKVSYVVTQNGEKFLTFAAIHLYGLRDVADDCEREESISFLKSFLKGKNIYLSSSDYGGYEEFTECRESSEKFGEFVKKYPITSKKIFIMDVELNDTFTWKALTFRDIKDSKATLANGKNLYIIEKSFGIIDANESIISSGYGYRKVWFPFCSDKSEKLHYDYTKFSNDDRQTEAAKVAKRGIWGDICN